MSGLHGKVIFDGFGGRDAFTARDYVEDMLRANKLFRKYDVKAWKYPNGRYRVWIERRMKPLVCDPPVSKYFTARD